MAQAVIGEPPRRERRRARIAARAAGLLFIAALATGALLLTRGGEPSPGPLRGYERSAVSFGQTAGRPLAYGLPILLNRGDEPARLDRVSIIDRPEGLELLDTQVNGANRREAIAGTTRWPTDEFIDLQPLDGHVVRPVDRGGELGSELVLVLRADRPGRYVFTRLRVDYRVGDKPHRVTIRNGLAVCATPPGERITNRCRTPADL